MKKRYALVLALLVVLAGLCAFLLRSSGRDGVPEAVLRAQQQLAVDLAQEMTDRVEGEIADLRRAAAAPSVDVQSLQHSYQGVALVDGTTHAPALAFGPPLPLDRLPPTTDVSVTPLPGDLRVLVAVEAPLGRLLVASVAAVPFVPVDGKLDQSLLLLDSSGGVVGKRGAEAAKPRPLGGQAGSFVDGDKVVAHAPVESSHLQGFTVVSVTKAQRDGFLKRWPGLVPAAALVLVAVAGLALARRKSGAFVVAAGVLAWSAAVAVVVGVARIDLPEGAVSAGNSRLGATADVLREVLADRPDTTRLGDLNTARAVYEEQVERGAYRNISVIDRAGTSLLSVGEQPQRKPGPLPVNWDVLLQDGVLFSTVTVEAHTVVAELDLEHIATLLRRAPGDVRLVDQDARTIATTAGADVPEPMAAAVRDVLRGKPGARVSDDAAIAARALEVTMTKGRLAVVSSQPAAEVNPAGAAQRRNAWLLAGAGVAIAVLSMASARRRL